MEKFSNTKGNMESWIETYSGKKFWYTTDDINGIDLVDIAHALSHICRYTGQCSFFYSVAEHSANVMALLPPHKRLWGLMHDASEAYLTDLASPAKQLFPEYKALEKRIMTRIAKKFGLPELFWEDEEIKRADWSQLQTEAKVLLPSGGEDWYFPKGLKVGHYPKGWDPQEAKNNFLSLFYDLTQNQQAA